ncbi:MAG: YigZ family protein [Sphingobacteriaceae bacterium]|nr:YigZ family protein [Sphingobacteriaceae bacterium]
MSRKNQLQSTCEGIYRDKGSKFIAYLYPITAEEAVGPLLEQLHKSHPSARHWCYAWRLGENGERYRSNDDGEPSGSAGRPILAAIDSAGLSNVLAVVVRYFGGTLLGVRGLIDAYGGAVLDALSTAAIQPMPHLRGLQLHCSYQAMAAMQSLMNEFGLKPQHAGYKAEAVLFQFEADESLIEPFKRRAIALYGVNVV